MKTYEALLAAGALLAAAALGGLAGYKLGSTPPPQPIIIQQPAAR